MTSDIQIWNVTNNKNGYDKEIIGRRYKDKWGSAFKYYPRRACANNKILKQNPTKSSFFVTLIQI